MRIYDDVIKTCEEIFRSYGGQKLDYEKNEWRDAGDYNMVLRHEMAYELGGSDEPSVSFIAYTSDEKLVCGDEIWLYGPDLSEIKKDSPYARVTFVQVSKDHFKTDKDTYTALRQIEYTRYHVSPEGFMTRIAASAEREEVRVSQEAIDKGIDFAKVGTLFEERYHKQKAVVGVKTIFITLPDFPYERLHEQAEKSEKITMTLDHIYKKINMDCSVCNLREVCEEIDELKELHFKQTKN